MTNFIDRRGVTHATPAVAVTKASGVAEQFSPEKLARSLKVAGADPLTVETIVQEISDSLYPGIPTKKVYARAFDLLRRSRRPLAARYSLKRAIMQLGPSGFPFEAFIGALLRAQGYEVRLNQTYRGRCVNHEVDVVAQNEQNLLLIECKFHNSPGISCDVKTALYIKARADDIREAWPETERPFKFNLYTNTRFTTDAIAYAKCSGVGLLGWDYPNGQGIAHMVDHYALYPVTCLTSISARDKQKLLDAQIVMCAELNFRRNELQSLGFTSQVAARVRKELDGLLPPITTAS